MGEYMKVNNESDGQKRRWPHGRPTPFQASQERFTCLEYVESKASRDTTKPQRGDLQGSKPGQGQSLRRQSSRGRLERGRSKQSRPQGGEPLLGDPHQNNVSGSRSQRSKPQ